MHALKPQRPGAAGPRHSAARPLAPASLPPPPPALSRPLPLTPSRRGAMGLGRLLASPLRGLMPWSEAEQDPDPTPYLRRRRPAGATQDRPGSDLPPVWPADGAGTPGSPEQLRSGAPGYSNGSHRHGPLAAASEDGPAPVGSLLGSLLGGLLLPALGGAVAGYALGLPLDAVGVAAA
ncbi:hypothetical protein HYH03_015992, partial [Edaphochlamys debaryana]